MRHKYAGRQRLVGILAPDVGKQLSVFFENYAIIKMMNDSLEGYGFIPDTVQKTVRISTLPDTTQKSTLYYFNPDATHFVLSGKLNDDSVYILMQKVDLNSFRLVNRGFHWINEYPYNQ